MSAENPEWPLQPLVQHYSHLVWAIASGLIRLLPPWIERDDLVQSGMVGLLEAARLFRANRRASFATYARIRIRGAMLDELRRSDHASRSLRRWIRDRERAIRQIERTEGRRARHEDIAAALGMTPLDYHRLLHNIANCHFISIEHVELDLVEGLVSTSDYADSLEDRLDSDARRSVLRRAIAMLPERDRQIITFHYTDGLLLREIGVALQLSESRICQIHRRALARLSALSGSALGMVEAPALRTTAFPRAGRGSP